MASGLCALPGKISRQLARQCLALQVLDVVQLFLLIAVVVRARRLHVPWRVTRPNRLPLTPLVLFL